MPTEDVYAAIDAAQARLKVAQRRAKSGDVRNAAELAFETKTHFAKLLRDEPREAFGEPRPCMEEAEEVMLELIEFTEKVMPFVRAVTGEDGGPGGAAALDLSLMGAA